MRQMKDSGVKWIGEVPEGWRILPHKHVMSKIKEQIAEYNNENILSLTMKGVIVRNLANGGKIPASFVGYQICKPGNLLMCLFDIDVTPRCIGLIKNEGVSSPAYSQFELKENANGAYYDYLLRYIDDYKCLLHLSKNLRSSLTESEFGLILTILPPLPEQLRIAAYLDEKCGDIDRLVSMQEEMIEELKAYKQSIITEAVTKGLDPDAKLKPSGVEWIDEIPEGWEVKRLKQLFSFKKGLSITKADLVTSGIPVINYGQIHSKQNTGVSINSNLLRFVPEYYISTDSSALVNFGDFIFADTSEDIDGCGNCVYIDKEDVLFAGYHTIIASSKNNVDNKYLAFLFKTSNWRTQIRSLVSGIKVFSISQRILSSSSVILPSIKEQQRIANYLDAKTSEIDSLIALKQQKITELKEYKKSLIYECVTGKKEIV